MLPININAVGASAASSQPASSTAAASSSSTQQSTTLAWQGAVLPNSTASLEIKQKRFKNMTNADPHHVLKELLTRYKIGSTVSHENPLLVNAKNIRKSISLKPKEINVLSTDRLEAIFHNCSTIVHQGEYEIALVSNKIGLLTNSIKTCIALAATGYDSTNTPVVIGLAHSDGIDETLAKQFMDDLMQTAAEQNMALKTVSLNIIGGYATSIAKSKESHYSIIVNQLKAYHEVLINIDQTAILNPYNVSEEALKYEREIDLIGYSINVGITSDGHIALAYDSALMQCEVKTLEWLAHFVSVNSEQITQMAKICATNPVEKKHMFQVINSILLEDKWITPVIRKNFLASCKLLSKQYAVFANQTSGSAAEGTASSSSSSSSASAAAASSSSSSASAAASIPKSSKRKAAKVESTTDANLDKETNHKDKRLKTELSKGISGGVSQTKDSIPKPPSTPL